MTPKDLNMAVYLKQMMDIGVNSFKVEGRMRSVYYIATVIYEYRNLFDKIKSTDEKMRAIRQNQNREKRGDNNAQND